MTGPDKGSGDSMRLQLGEASTGRGRDLEGKFSGSPIVEGVRGPVEAGVESVLSEPQITEQQRLLDKADQNCGVPEGYISSNDVRLDDAPGTGISRMALVTFLQAQEPGKQTLRGVCLRYKSDHPLFDKVYNRNNALVGTLFVKDGRLLFEPEEQQGVEIDVHGDMMEMKIPTKLYFGPGHVEALERWKSSQKRFRK